MNRHAFTVAEVNAMLPRIRRAAEQVKRYSGRLNRLSGDLYVDNRPEVDTLVDQGYMEGLTQEDIWWRPNSASNSIGNLVLHLAGNIRQWVVIPVLIRN